MKAIIIVFYIFLTTALSFGQTSNKNEYNLGFENYSFNQKLPHKWFEGGSGYKIKIDTLIKNCGKASILIEPNGGKSSRSFGCIAYAIPANYEAKEIELRAFMKLHNVSHGPIGLMIRIDGIEGTLGFENMEAKNIQGTRDWAVYSVKIPYPDNAKVIYIGAILSGEGQLWVDDFSVLLDGNDIAEANPKTAVSYKADGDHEFDSGSRISSLKLTESCIDNLDILGKVWGYIKYYHPSVARGEYNWDYELFRILPIISSAKNVKERNVILKNWVIGLGEVDVEKQTKVIQGEIKLLPDLSWITAEALGSELFASLNLIKDIKRMPEHYYIGLINRVGNPEFKNERPYIHMNYPDVAFRLLSLYRYWNIINYYFPYKNLIKEDWDKVLREYIPKFINAANELEYKLAVLSIIARIHDTHANIWGRDRALHNYKGLRFAPLKIYFVESKAVVLRYYDEVLGNKSGLKIGDVIESVNGKPVEEIINERLPLTPASNYPTQLRDIAEDLLRTNSSTLYVTCFNHLEKTPKPVETFDVDDINRYAQYQDKKDTCYKLINSDISYLYLGSIKNEYLPKIIPQIIKTKGLIIDFRCYPSDFLVFSLSEYLLSEPKKFVKFSTGSITTPGLFTMREPLTVGKSNPSYFKGKVVIIINEKTQSSAEYHTMAFRTAPRTTVIGSTTAGADGNVSRFNLPGGINTMISGIGVYYPDGRETQRIGIVPDLIVKPTIEGIKNGRDELLEKAIQIINGD